MGNEGANKEGRVMKHSHGMAYINCPECAKISKQCLWTEDDNGNYDTGCGHCFTIIDGTPADNGMKFCVYCGGKLIEEGLAESDPDGAGPPEDNKAGREFEQKKGHCND